MILPHVAVIDTFSTLKVITATCACIGVLLANILLLQIIFIESIFSEVVEVLILGHGVVLEEWHPVAAEVHIVKFLLYSK